MAKKTTKVEGVTLTIDGQGLTVPRGTTLLEAAQSAGVEVPHYCYHPGLSSPAMCRLCLVEVEGAPQAASVVHNHSGGWTGGPHPERQRHTDAARRAGILLAEPPSRLPHL